MSERKNHLSNGHYTMPGVFVQAMTTREMRETMLATDGRILACGHSWDVVAQSLGAGTYRVTTKRTPLPEVSHA